MNQFPNRLLTIDMGRACGYAFALNAEPKEWGTDKIVPNDSTTGLQRWRDWIEHKIRKYKPDYIVYEKPFISRNTASQSLLQREGILLMVASDFKVPIQGVAVSTLKKTVTENGRASKEQMIKSIRLLFNIDVSTDHEADALACLVWAIKDLSGPTSRERTTAVLKSPKGKSYGVQKSKMLGNPIRRKPRR